MATVFVSPGVFTREIDLSFVPAAVTEIGAAMVGPTKSGPAFTPTIINTFEEFREIYGGTDKNLFLPYAAKNYLTNGSTMTVCRVLGTESSTNQGAGYYLRFGGSGATGSVMAIMRLRAGETASEPFVHVLAQNPGAQAASLGLCMSGTIDNFALCANGLTAENLSFDPTSSNYITNRLGTDPTASGGADELGMYYIDRIFQYNYDMVKSRGLKFNDNEVANPDHADLAYWQQESLTGSSGQGDPIGECLGAIANDVDPTGWPGMSGVSAIVGMISISGMMDPAGTIYKTYQNSLTPWVMSQNINGGCTKLFKVHSIESGDSSNTKIKVGIIMQQEQVTNSTWPLFTIVVRKWSDTNQNAVVLESFSNCSLNPDASNYVCKAVGDRYPIWEGLGGAGSPDLTFGGQYDNKSKYIRVEISTETMQKNYRPAGYRGIPKANVTSPVLSGGATIFATEVLSGYTASNIPQLRYKTNNFSSGTIPDPNQYAGVDYDTADVSMRLSGIIACGPTEAAYTSLEINSGLGNPATEGPSGVDSVLTFDPGFIMFNGDTEAGSTTAGLSSYIGGWINDSNSAGINVYLPTHADPVTFSWTKYDGTGTAENTAKFYQFLVPLYGGYDGLDQRTKLATQVTNGSLSSAYVDSIDILSNADEYDFNMFATPGITNVSIGGVQQRGLDMCAARGDAFCLVEMGIDTDGTSDNKAMTVQQAVQAATGMDSSYGGVWFPWLRIYDADLDELVWVPPTIETVGVLAFTDIVADPWFAPAGFNRGGLPNVIEAYRRLTMNQRDTLYEGKVNPIATFAGSGIFVFGQKTLQTAASALDRINVRRMLLYARKLVASASRTILFEQNTMQTRNKLANMINEILRPIKVRQGLAEFKIVINETNNTAATIDANQIVGAIYLQPVKTAEIIVLDFNIMRTGASFEEV